MLRRRSSSAAAAVTAAFALVHTGDAAGLHALIARRMHRAGQRERVALARLLTEAGDPATALDLLRDAPAIPPVRPVRGRVLHVLNNSLPHVVAGYTVGSHRVAQAQRNAGLRPVMHRPAVLHPTSPFDNARAALALRAATGLPVVYEVRGFLEATWRARVGDGAERTDRYRRTRAIEGWCMREADRVVTLGEAMRADIIDRGVDPDHIVVIPNAVDPDDFVPRPADPTLRARLGFVAGDVVLGYVSSLVATRGSVTCCRRSRCCAGADGPSRLIVGDGAERAGLQHLAGWLGVGDDVRFVVRVPVGEVQRWYAQIDVFVVPRTNDRVARAVTPLKPLEAMALARAVVTSDLPALRELINPGITGLVFDAGDAVNLADTVEPILDDPGARARLGAAARDWVATERTWRHIGARYRRLYAELGAV